MKYSLNQINKKAILHLHNFYKKMIDNIQNLKHSISLNYNDKSVKAITNLEYKKENVYKSAKFVTKLLNIFYIDLKLVNSFKKWHVIAL